jgi:hypothetical protein
MLVSLSLDWSLNCSACQLVSYRKYVRGKVSLQYVVRRSGGVLSM